MPNIENVFKNIINPQKEFLLISFINDKYLELVYEKIYIEFVNWIKKRKINIKKCKFNKNQSIIVLSTKYAYEIKISFKEDEVCVFINEINLGCSKIYGAYLDKENLIVSNIQVDLITFKKKLLEIIK